MKALRALIVILLGWASIRSAAIFLSSPATQGEVAVPQSANAPSKAIASVPTPVIPPGAPIAVVSKRLPLLAVESVWRPETRQVSLLQVERVDKVASAGDLGERFQNPSAIEVGRSEMAFAKREAEPQPAALAAREGFAISTWSIIRSGSSARAIADGGQLGASQAGIRIWAPPIAALAGWKVRPTVRASSALQGQKQQEAALGVALRRGGSQADLQLIAERRIAIDAGGRNAFAALAAGGVSRSLFGNALRIESYAQAGVVGIRRKDFFADGAARLTGDVREIGGLSIEAGGGIWAGAQPGLSRVDVGPSIAGKVRVGPATLRTQLDYRFRTLGRAAPSSGPALSASLAI